MAVIEKSKILIFLCLLSIIAIASFFRLWQLNSLPSGLFPDEAANGLDIVNYIFQGHHSPFFERGLGREALFFYLQAVSVALFGIGVWQLHLVSALIGILTVVATWFLAKKLFNVRVAFLASFFLATSAWHITLSRTGFRAIMVPLMATLFFYFVYLTFKEVSGKKRILFAILAGSSLGLGFYTYISFRAMVIIIGLLAIIIAVINRGIFKKFWREIVIGLISMLIILSPLIGYFINHPDSFAGRAGGVSIFNPDLNQGNVFGTFLGVLKKTSLMFFTEGDLNWRHNVSGFSMLNPFVIPLFAFGFLYSLLMSIKRFIRKKVFQENLSRDYFKYLFLVVWFLGMLGPVLLSVESVPHGLRAIGAMPAVFFFPAIMVDFFWKKNVLNFGRKIIFGVVLALILGTSLVYDYFLYFGISANSPDFYYAYRSDLTIVSNYLNERNFKEKTYLVLDKYSVQTPEFLTARYYQPYILVDPATSEQTQLKPGDQIIFTQSTIFDTKKFKLYHPETKLIKKEFNQFNQEIMRIYEK
ncbi:glycosyltransferase family 39 protein [Patescibacteria group bacterium]|nr:glycosyltransferase family 39 protein [Patescibacteria group bacterium]MBU4481420.1 glycosyltransferase family 39 protein [Patescibacteria group bacterium]